MDNNTLNHGGIYPAVVTVETAEIKTATKVKSSRKIARAAVAAVVRDFVFNERWYSKLIELGLPSDEIDAALNRLTNALENDIISLPRN